MTNEQFKRIREALNMTQQELADALGVSQGAVSLWENGKNDIIPVVQKLLLTMIDEKTLKNVLAS